MIDAQVRDGHNPFCDKLADCAARVRILSLGEQLVTMSDPDITSFRKKLDDLSARLHARSEELRRTGEFRDIHAKLLDEIHHRNDALKGKVAEAERKGTTWELVKAGLARDYSSLFDDLLQVEARLDAATMKHARRAIAAFFPHSHNPYAFHLSSGMASPISYLSDKTFRWSGAAVHV